MSDAPDGIRLDRHRELAGRGWHPWVHRLLLGLVGVVVLLALLNEFGQRPSTARAAGALATLAVDAPTRLRSGLLYTARFRVTARRELKKAFLVLDPGWFEGMQLNSLAPNAVGESSRDGRVAYELGHIPAGGSYVLFVSLQVNPTNVGSRSQDVELDDGPARLVTVHRSVTVFP